jgi:predicted nucleotidyltransferase
MEAKTVVKELARLNEVKAIALFGSVARGDAKLTSDIDLLVVVSKQGVEDKIRSLAIEMEERTGKKIQTIVKTVRDLKKTSSALLLNVLQHGKLLYLAPGTELPLRSLLPLRPATLFTYDTANLNQAERVRLARALYGYTQKIGGKTYSKKGLLRKYRGRRIGKATIIVPSENKEAVERFLNDAGVRFSETHVFV